MAIGASVALSPHHQQGGTEAAVTDSARWHRVKELFDAALALAPHARDSFLSKACGTDSALQMEVESLLVAHADAGSFAQQLPVPPLRASTFAPPTEGTPPQVQVLAVGDRLGPYEIIGALGAGGM